MMNSIDLENALMSTIVDYISDQVILRYTQSCKRAVVMFTGALIGYTDAVETLRQLKEDGWKFTAVLSKAAEQVLTKERIEKDIDPDAIFVEGAPVNGKQLVSETQYVIIPSLTINTASKVANCIMDNLVTNMIFTAMAQGKPVIAAVDGCCPDNKVREKIGFEVTEAYKKKMRDHLVSLISYGIHLTTAKSLFEKVDKVFCSDFDYVLDDPYDEDYPEPSTSCGCAPKDVPASKEVRIGKKVIGRIDVMENAGCKTIIVDKDAIVTGLAKDEAQTRCIKIVHE